MAWEGGAKVREVSVRRQGARGGAQQYRETEGRGGCRRRDRVKALAKVGAAVGQSEGACSVM